MVREILEASLELIAHQEVHSEHPCCDPLFLVSRPGRTGVRGGRACH